MKKNLSLIILCIISLNLNSQSIANYAVTRNTGIAYSSISTTGNVITYWRNQTVNQNDDNRSNPVPIGFDFWYNSKRYTTVSISVNGFIDFSSTVYDGNDSPGYSSGSGFVTCGGAYTYRESPVAFSTGGCGAVAPNYYDGTYLALAAMYTDLWTGNGGSLVVANSIKYLTTGIAPNRIFTVEYINMDDWASASNSDYNFQIKLYESSGKIEFVYGTMNPSAGSPTPYATGINCIFAGATPAVSEMLEQQTANSATFNSTIQSNLTTAPQSNTKITFTPPCTTNPGSSLTFSGIGNIGMTLNWTNWAPAALGYVIYQSTDGINYTFASQVGAGITTASFTNLFGSTYWWKVYAVTEGCLTLPISGSQATLPSGIFISIATGNWSNPTTWNAGAVPTLGDNVIIDNTHTVTIDNTNFGCTNLTVGQGASGILLLGNSTTARTFTIIGDLLINSGGDFEPNPGFAATHSITAIGNFINNGTLNFRTSATRCIDVSFTKNGNQTISGTGVTTQFNKMVMNMGNTLNNVLEVTSSIFTAPNNFLTMVNGTFKFSVPSFAVTLNIFSTPVTIPNTCGIWMNSPNSTMVSLSTLVFQGDLKLTNGILKVGNIADESLISNGALLTITNGTMEVAGRLTRPSFVAVTNFSMTGGQLTLNTMGSNDASPSLGTPPAYPFMIDVPGSTFFMTGGKIIIRNMGSGASGLVNAGYCNLNCSPYVFTGGTLQIGDATTTAGQTMKINTDNSIANLVVNNSSVNNPIALQEVNLTVTKDVLNNTGSVLNCNSKNLSIAGSFTNNGTFTSGTNTLTFNGTAAQQVTGSNPTLPAFDLAINNTSGDVTINNLISNVNVAGTLRFNSGKLIIGTNNVNITSGNNVVGFNASKYVVTTGTSLTGGFLQINNIGASARDFPIGINTTVYTPILNFLNAGTVDNYKARIFNTVLVSGISGAAQTINWVDKTWMITESIVGGSNVNMSVQWNASNELPSFTRPNCGITHFDSSFGLWDTPTNIGAATGVGPYQQFRNNLTSFSSFGVINGAVILPIELSQFTGQTKNADNLLNWETATEINNDYFNLEHSVDGLNFVNLATIKGAGTSNNTKNYNYTHQQPLPIINYYRLKQTDYNPRNKYSNIVSINNFVTAKDNEVFVYPNPTTNIVNIKFTTVAKGELTIELINAMGRVIYKTNFIAEKGKNNKQLDINSINAGIYELKIIIDGTVNYKKLVVE